MNVLNEFVDEQENEGYFWLKDFAEENAKLLNSEFDIGTFVLYDQFKGCFMTVSIRWLLLDNYLANATTIDSGFSKDEHSKEYFELTEESVDVDPG